MDGGLDHGTDTWLTVTRVREIITKIFVYYK